MSEPSEVTFFTMEASFQNVYRNATYHNQHLIGLNLVLQDIKLIVANVMIAFNFWAGYDISRQENVTLTYCWVHIRLLLYNKKSGLERDPTVRDFRGELSIFNRVMRCKCLAFCLSVCFQYNNSRTTIYLVRR